MGLISSFKRESQYLSAMLRMLRSVKDVDPASDRLVCDDLERLCDKFSQNIAFLEDDKTMTYQEVEDYANRVANWAIAEGCTKGDTVAVFLRNRLEDIKVFLAFGSAGDYHDFSLALSNTPPHRPGKHMRDGIKAGDQCMKMFTSGTTGMPKAAKVTHVRAQNYMRGFAAGAKTTSSDRMLMVLPMYHATGGLCGVGAAVTNGGGVIVRPKFSASKFWDEAVEYEATLFMYVGELCRFLLSTPPHPKEKAHKLRWAMGNGLRPEVWPGFVGRFNIPNVIEFYGATEGNVSLISVNGPVGAVGRVPNYLRSKFNCEIIRYDVETGTNVRGADGFCIKTDNGEVGELIGEIQEDNARFRFDGYENEEATKKKILRDVFKKGDAWFRTGDLMKHDALGYYYFMDRVGDTYRWKAENVATGEVAAAISSFKGVTQANVYGVQVPGYDGRAGMAAIVSEGLPDMKALKTHIDAALPHYARPVFLRLSRETDTTSTFKFKKTNLVKAGFDPANISDPLYYADSVTGEYNVLTKEVFDGIKSGTIRL